MKIRVIGRDFDVDVYGIYWADGEIYFYIIPYKGYEGISSRSGKECKIIDSKLNDFVLYERNSGDYMLIHDAAYQDSLLDKLIDHQPEAMREFLRRLETYRPSLPGKTEICPCCERRTLNTTGSYETCLVCGWIDDPIQSDDPNYAGGENELSLNEAKEAFFRK